MRGLAFCFLFACSDPCAPGTLLVDVTLDPASAQAVFLDFNVAAVDGSGTPLTGRLPHTAGQTAGSVELRFPNYPAGLYASVRVTARSADQTAIGRGATPVTLAESCTHTFVLIDVIQPEPADLAVASDLREASFTPRMSGVSVDLRGLTFGNGQFVTVGAAGKIAGSLDGVQWALHPSTLTADLESVTWGDSTPLYVTVGAGGFNASSPDGITWTPRPLVLQSLHVVRHAGSNFVTAGAAGSLYLSGDGTMWTSLSSHVTQPLYGLAVGAGIAVFGAAGAVTASGDQGLSWAQVNNVGVAFDLACAAFGGGRYLALGSGGNVVSSPDLTSWSATTTGASASMHGLTWDGSRFWAVGDGGTIVSSSDGQSFTQHPSGTSVTLYDVAAGAGHIVAVGAAGTIVTLP